DPEFHVPHFVGEGGPKAGFEDAKLGNDLPVLAPAHAADGFLFDGGECLGRMVAEPGFAVGDIAVVVEVAAAGTIGRFCDAEVRRDLVLETQLPGPRSPWVVAPEAAVSDGER